MIFLGGVVAKITVYMRLYSDVIPPTTADDAMLEAY